MRTEPSFLFVFLVQIRSVPMPPHGGAAIKPRWAGRKLRVAEI